MGQVIGRQPLEQAREAPQLLGERGEGLDVHVGELVAVAVGDARPVGLRCHRRRQGEAGHEVGDRRHALVAAHRDGVVDPLPREGQGRLRQRVHEDQRLDALGVLEHQPLGDDAAHRVAEQVEALQPEGVEGGDGIGDELVERVARRIAGVGRVAVATVVPRHHPTVGGEVVDDVGPVDAATGEPVDEDQRGRVTPASVIDGQRDGSGVDGAIRFVHGAAT